MYKTFLGYARLKEYVPALTEMGLLHYDRDAQTFKISQKGFRFLNSYNRLYETMKKKKIPSPIQ